MGAIGEDYQIMEAIIPNITKPPKIITLKMLATFSVMNPSFDMKLK